MKFILSAAVSFTVLLVSSFAVSSENTQFPEFRNFELTSFNGIKFVSQGHLKKECVLVGRINNPVVSSQADATDSFSQDEITKVFADHKLIEFVETNVSAKSHIGFYDFTANPPIVLLGVPSDPQSKELINPTVVLERTYQHEFQSLARFPSIKDRIGKIDRVSVGFDSPSGKVVLRAQYDSTDPEVGFPLAVLSQELSCN